MNVGGFVVITHTNAGGPIWHASPPPDVPSDRRAYRIIGAAALHEGRGSSVDSSRAGPCNPPGYLFAGSQSADNFDDSPHGEPTYFTC